MMVPTIRDRLRLAGHTANPDKLEGDLEKYEHLAATCHYQSWRRDCTMMVEFL